MSHSQGEAWHVRNRHELHAFLQFVQEQAEANVPMTYSIIREQRTLRQNSALHAYLEEVAEQLNARGKDMRTVLKDGVPIPWDKATAKKYLWVPIQRAMTDKEKTSELDTAEVDKVYQTLSRMLAEKHGISVAFGHEF